MPLNILGQCMLMTTCMYNLDLCSSSPSLSLSLSFSIGRHIHHRALALVEMFITESYYLSLYRHAHHSGLREWILLYVALCTIMAISRLFNSLEHPAKLDRAPPADDGEVIFRLHSHYLPDTGSSLWSEADTIPVGYVDSPQYLLSSV